jgi:transposase-like protein
MSKSPVRKQHYPESERIAHVEQWQRSGQSQTVYCKRHHLSRNTLRGWIATYTAGGTSELPKQGSADGTGCDLVSVELAAPVGGSAVGYAEMQYPTGAKLILHHSVLPDVLRALLS